MPSISLVESSICLNSKSAKNQKCIANVLHFKLMNIKIYTNSIPAKYFAKCYVVTVFVIKFG